MTWTMWRGASALRLVSVLALLAAAGAGCGALDVSDPTAIEEEELEDAAGAGLLRAYALKRFYVAFGPQALASGLVADELLAEPPASSGIIGAMTGEEALDRRASEQYEALGASPDVYSAWQEARRAATLAIPGLQTYGPIARVGEMFAIRGYATLHLAADFCPGLPLHTVVDFKVVYGGPLGTDEVLERAVADFDSALVYAADSARILDLARVGKARTLVTLGRFNEAAAAAAPVPTSYVRHALYNANSPAFQTNWLGRFMEFGELRRGVADRDGGTGLDFVSAGDPRVQTTLLGMSSDGVTAIYAPAKYPDGSAPIVLASGIEARLIEAEAALNGGGDWLGILNALRTTCTLGGACPDPAPAGTGGVAGLPPLTDPGTTAAREDLLFRERAFWLFATGQRLGDLRRLIRLYGRAPETVFPTGAYRFGGSYETGTSIPFPAAEEVVFNPAVTGCTSR